jgi:SOS response regulatory protein OraA/RecX
MKGVSRDIAREAVDEIFSDEDEEFSSALAVAEKYKKDLDTPKGKNRLYGALSRRGFGYGVIKKVMQTLCSDLDYFEE